MIFTTNHQDELPFSTEIPAELIGHHIPGSLVSAVSNGYAKLLLQELASSAGPVYYSTFRMDRKTLFRIRDQGPFLFACIPLQHENKLDLYGIGPMVFREGQFNIMYSPVFDYTSAHEGGKEYISLNLQYGVAALEEWAAYFPALETFLEQVRAGEPAVLLDEHAWLTREIQDVIHQLLHSSRDKPANPLYFDLLVKTLLFHLLLQSVQRLPRSRYSHYESNGIHEAREVICRNIRYHYKIRELAQKVGMNEFKLKNGFRETYGDGPYEYLVSERMREARKLLVDANRNIKEIAALLGYQSMNSFIKAFKRRYQQTPGQFRLKGDGQDPGRA